jgi:hypothetical protein
MRSPFVLIAALALLLFAAEANARAYDAKGLARYDASYAKCESQFPEMRGHGDDAYLNLWRIRVDDSSQARLAKLRSSAAYQAERRRFLQAASKSASAAASSPLSRECQGLWGEYQRNGKPSGKPAK